MAVKVKPIFYWITTLWLCFGMLSSALVQLFRVEGAHEFIIVDLGYPAYFLNIIGVWKILGVAALLAPGFTLLKEWAYAGVFFLSTGAVFSHIATKSSFGDIFPGLLLTALVVASWSLRPASRRLPAT